MDKRINRLLLYNKNAQGQAEIEGSICVSGIWFPALESGVDRGWCIVVKGKARSIITMRKMEAEAKLLQVVRGIWVGIVGLV